MRREAAVNAKAERDRAASGIRGTRAYAVPFREEFTTVYRPKGENR